MWANAVWMCCHFSGSKTTITVLYPNMIKTHYVRKKGLVTLWSPALPAGIYIRAQCMLHSSRDIVEGVPDILARRCKKVPKCLVFNCDLSTRTLGTSLLDFIHRKV